MATLRTTLTDILKEDYLPPVIDQFNTKVLLRRLLERNSRDFGGDGAYIPLLSRRTHSHGARAEGGTLPTAVANTYRHATVPAKFNYSKIKISGPSMSVARKDKYAFLRTLNAEVRASTEGFINDYNRQLFGNGSGVLTRTGVTAGATTVVLDTTNKDGGFGTRYLEEGMRIDIRNATTGAFVVGGDSNIIVDVDDDAQTIEVAVAVTTAITDAIFVEDNWDIVATAVESHEIMGLHGIIAERNPTTIQPSAPATLEGIDRIVAGGRFWQALVEDNGGVLRPLDFPILHDLLIAIDLRAGLGDGTSAFITTHFLWKKYGLLMTPDRRYAGDPMIFEGGFKFLTFDGIKMFFEKHCQPNRIYAPNVNYLTIFEESPVRWDETDGALLKWDNLTDGFEAFLVYYSNLGTDRPQANGVLEDLIE